MTNQTKTVSSVHSKTITLINTQYLWSPGWELHKNQTVNILAWCKKGVTVIHPDLDTMDYWYLLWMKESVSIKSMDSGGPTRLQKMAPHLEAYGQPKLYSIGYFWGKKRGYESQKVRVDVGGIELYEILK